MTNKPRDVSVGIVESGGILVWGAKFVLRGSVKGETAKERNDDARRIEKRIAELLAQVDFGDI